jgi:hypothetical protein
MHTFEHSTPNASHASPGSRQQRIGPVFALLLLAPVVAEVLYGATRVSVLFVLIPEIMVWGLGALLIRECLRRWNKGWETMLLLGIALAIAEEFVIQQTSLAPLVGVTAHAYGRVWGVNWVYCLWAIGYESGWVVLIPVQLTELLFPDRRQHLWLRPRGMALASFIFVVGACMAWYGWTQRARVKIFHMQPYSPPPIYVAGAIVAILLLVVSAYALPTLRRASESSNAKKVPSAWRVGATCFALGAPWAAFALLGWGTGAVPKVPFQAVLACGGAWAALTLLLMQRWTSSRDWNDAHRYSVVFGGIMACIVGGFAMFKFGGALRVDWVGKAILDTVAIVWLIRVGRSIQKRSFSQLQTP